MERGENVKENIARRSYEAGTKNLQESWEGMEIQFSRAWVVSSPAGNSEARFGRQC